MVQHNSGYGDIVCDLLFIKANLLVRHANDDRGLYFVNSKKYLFKPPHRPFLHHRFPAKPPRPTTGPVGSCAVFASPSRASMSPEQSEMSKKVAVDKFSTR